MRLPETPCCEMQSLLVKPSSFKAAVTLAVLVEMYRSEDFWKKVEESGPGTSVTLPHLGCTHHERRSFLFIALADMAHNIMQRTAGGRS